MGQIVQRKKGGVIALLPLPGRRAVPADAFHEDAAVGALGELNLQAGQV